MTATRARRLSRLALLVREGDTAGAEAQLFRVLWRLSPARQAALPAASIGAMAEVIPEATPLLPRVQEALEIAAGAANKPAPYTPPPFEGFTSAALAASAVGCLLEAAGGKQDDAWLTGYCVRATAIAISAVSQRAFEQHDPEGAARRLAFERATGPERAGIDVRALPSATSDEAARAAQARGWAHVVDWLRQAGFASLPLDPDREALARALRAFREP